VCFSPKARTSVVGEKGSAGSFIEVTRREYPILLWAQRRA
jgi:hypothetical protein